MTARSTTILGTAVAGLVALALVGNPLHARQQAAPHVRVSLAADVASFVPGTPFTVAVVFDVERPWHTYYQDPGDSGMPPEIRWTLPEGLTAGPLRFPLPEVLKTPAGTNFVYAERHALLVTMTPDANLKVGRAVTIKADAKWLECDADVCVPGKGTADVSVDAAERVAPANADDFAAWRAAVDRATSFDPKAARN